MEATLAPLAPLRRGELLEVDQIIFKNVPSKARLQAPTRPAADQARARRVIDVVLALTLLVLFAPLLALIAVAIRLDSPGPVLFRQRRLGQDATPFTMLKFRSMRTDADEALHKDFATNMIMGDAPGGEVYKVWPDPRVTRVGHWIRTLSLDELPQLWNVLRGDMSLVGFRPPIPYEVECYPEWYYGRFSLKPGITGLWQVSGRNEKTYEEMVAYDIEYAERRDWKLDARLLFRTVGVVLARRGAY